MIRLLRTCLEDLQDVGAENKHSYNWVISTHEPPSRAARLRLPSAEMCGCIALFECTSLCAMSVMSGGKDSFSLARNTSKTAIGKRYFATSLGKKGLVHSASAAHIS